MKGARKVEFFRTGDRVWVNVAFKIPAYNLRNRLCGTVLANLMASGDRAVEHSYLVLLDRVVTYADEELSSIFFADPSELVLVNDYHDDDDDACD